MSVLKNIVDSGVFVFRDSTPEEIERDRQLDMYSEQYNILGPLYYYAQYLVFGDFSPKEAMMKMDKYRDMPLEELENIVCFQRDRSSEEFMNDINSILA